LLIVNEVEVSQLTNESNPSIALERLRNRCPETLIVMTLGAQGMVAAKGKDLWQQAAFPTKVVDTTAAGDTVTGYLLAGLSEGLSAQEALSLAAQAAAITVSRAGAAASIPLRAELDTLKN
jgi:ribokinase